MLNGKPVRWSGENYGWQSFASHDKLKIEGKFRFGAQTLDRVGSSLNRLLPAPIKEAVKAAQAHMAENERRVAARDSQTAVGRYFINPIKAVTQAPAKVQQALVNKASEVTNVDPRIVGFAGEVAGDFLLGKVGALRGAPKVAAPTPLVTRQSRGGGVQRGIQRQVQASRGVSTGELGAVGFPNRLMQSNSNPFVRTTTQVPNNHQPKQLPTQPIKTQDPNPIPNLSTKAQRAPFKPADIPQNPPKEGTPSWASSPELEDQRLLLVQQGLPDPNARFRPLPTTQPMKRADKENLVTQIDPNTGKASTNINEFYSKNSAYGVSKGDKTFKYNGETITTKGATSRQAEVRQMPGYEDVKIDWYEAHHERPLKDLADYVNTFDDPQLALAAYDKTGQPRGSSVLNRTDLPQRLHTGGNKNNAAHSRLRNEMPGSPEAGYPLEAQSGTNRWEFLRQPGMTDEQRLQYLPYLMADAQQNVKVAQQTAFSQYQLQPENNSSRNPYIGNLSQQVLMPPDKRANSLIAEVRRRRRGER